jgi:hypothetical protein
MARVYDEVLSVPESLLEAVRGAAPAPARSMSSSVSRPALFERIGDFFRLPVFSPALAIPAIAVAAAGGWFASTALHYVPMEQRGYAASAPLQKALEATPSGSTAAVIEGLSLKPTLTFAGLEKTWCRQVELTQGRPSLRSEGLACRMADGSWRVIAFTEPEPPPAPPKPGAFEPAGNVDPLQNIQSEIRRGDVLDGDAVESLIKDGWKTKPGN